MRAKRHLKRKIMLLDAKRTNRHMLDTVEGSSGRVFKL